jgi:SAM-dependent methyltransferase
VTPPHRPALEPSQSASDPPQVAPPDAGLSGHAQRNRAAWNADADHYQARHGRQLAGGGKAWGTWGLPESELQVLGEVAGRDVLELGCGAAQGSIDLARAGARPVGLDLSEGQLGHARRLILETGMAVPLVQASAEAVPLADGSFDIVFCDHGAMNFADPYRTVPEAARRLRPGGLFAFCHLSPIVDLC